MSPAEIAALRAHLPHIVAWLAAREAVNQKYPTK